MGNFDDLRATRDYNSNPPEFAPKQGGDTIDWDSVGSIPSSSMDSTFGALQGGGDDISSILNAQMGMQGQQPQQGATGALNDSSADVFDKVLAILAEIGKKFWSFVTLFVESLTNNSSGDWHNLGVRLMFVSAICLCIGGLMCFLGIFIPGFARRGSNLMIAVLFDCIVGICLSFAFKKGNVSEVNKSLTTENDMQTDLSNESGFSWDDPTDEDSIVETSESLDDSGDSDDFWGSFDDSDFDDGSTEIVKTSPEEALAKLDTGLSGITPRSVLYEVFMSQLPTMNQNFKRMEEVVDGSDEFMYYYQAVQDAATQTGITDEEKIPEVTKVQKNLFIIQITCTRPAGIKEEQIADLVADTYKRDENGRISPEKESVYASVDTMVGSFIINIFLSNKVMVSLADVYSQPEVKEFVLNPKTQMPIIWGINEYGRAFYYDGLKSGNGDLIISGEKRSGKSWKGQSIIAQICMFLSPRDVEFYFFDSKGVTSDYLYLSSVLPHARDFCSDPLKFNEKITSILDTEIKKREKVLGGKYTNVKDYNRDNPENRLSTVYVVIDEIASAREAMKTQDKDLDNAFVSTLKVLATKCPNLEIKLIVFPHRIVNEMIPKSVSAMISTRMQMGSMGFEELKASLDIKNRKEFPYNLVKEGDMAFKTKDINSGRVIYCHAEVLTGSEEDNRKLFDFIASVWKKVDPDFVKNPIKLPINTTTEGVVENSKSGIYTPKDTSFSSTGRYEPAEGVLESLPSVEGVDESFWDDMLKENRKSDNNSDVDLSLGNIDTDDIWDNW